VLKEKFCLKVVALFLMFLSFSVRAAEPVCDGSIPFCDRDYSERSQLPESMLHDTVPQEFLEPQTDIFLDFQIQAVQGIREKYAYVDPKHEIEARPLELALSYYDKLKNELKRPEYLGIISYKTYSHNSRFIIINMKTGLITKTLVAHGEGSDPKNTGYAKYFSNTDNSHMSSLGAFITAETYSGKNGYSLRIDGIEHSNSNIRKRAVVIHGSDYVNPKTGRVGMSWGCPAVNRGESAALINKVKNGVLFLAWYDQ
jgi:hypothetical protein